MLAAIFANTYGGAEVEVVVQFISFKICLSLNP